MIPLESAGGARDGAPRAGQREVGPQGAGPREAGQPTQVRCAVIGATGFTGAELLRLLAAHPAARVTSVVARSTAGERIGDVLPAWSGRALLGDGEERVSSFDAASVSSSADVAFCALPHAASAPIVRELRQRDVTVFDLSADFRLRDLAEYEAWYGPHAAPELIGGAVYGLVELYRAALREADLVAVPGCYPTATVLPLAPLFAAGALCASGPIVVDAKSGVSGAGRPPKDRTTFSETSGGLRSYAIAGRHRHTPEIEQELSAAAGEGVRVIFSPHLVPMTRGILTTSYLQPRGGADAARFTELARARYADSPSVRVLDPGASPDTLWVRGSNGALVSYTDDARSGWVVAQCAIDNLVKGAAGQAVQGMNVRFGLPEDAGVGGVATWP